MSTHYIQRLIRIFTLILCVHLIQVNVLGQGSQSVVNVRQPASESGIRNGDSFELATVLTIAPGYHINAHQPTLDYLIPTKIVFQKSKILHLDTPRYPIPYERSFSFSPGQSLAVYEDTVIIKTRGTLVNSGTASSVLIQGKLTFQACNDTQCLSPIQLPFKISLSVFQSNVAGSLINEEIFNNNESLLLNKPKATKNSNVPLLKEFPSSSKKDVLSESIDSRGFLVTLGLIFLAGLALNTTPCIYPIIPITIGFFTNQADGHLRKTFQMALSYVLGMAITYSILGVVASMTQGIFGSALQHPLVLVGLGAIMVAMALSMFGLFEFRLPNIINQLAAQNSTSTHGTIGALLMGLSMGVVAAPCIGPFVIGLLVHVSSKGNPVYGFFLFFVLALGLGFPYLFLGTFSGALKNLPRSGQWLITTRKIFGLILLGMALYFLNPLLDPYTPWALALLAGGSSIYLIFQEAPQVTPPLVKWVLRVVGIGLMVFAISLVIPSQSEEGISWETYSETTLVEARNSGKPVMIDVYADWCIPCKELDQYTFSNPLVKTAVKGFTNLKLDMTTNEPNSESSRARSRFNILGVPTIIFLDPTGQEFQDFRLEGFEASDPFMKRINQIKILLKQTEQPESLD